MVVADSTPANPQIVLGKVVQVDNFRYHVILNALAIGINLMSHTFEPGQL